MIGIMIRWYVSQYYMEYGIWDVMLQNRIHIMIHSVYSNTKLNLIIQQDKTSFKLTNSVHTYAGSPTIETFHQGINRFFCFMTRNKQVRLQTSPYW